MAALATSIVDSTPSQAQSRLVYRFQYGQVPALEVGGRKLVQSAAILRYIGKQCGLYPEDPLDAAQVQRGETIVASHSTAPQVETALPGIQ